MDEQELAEISKDQPRGNHGSEFEPLRDDDEDMIGVGDETEYIPKKSSTAGYQ